MRGKKKRCQRRRRARKKWGLEAFILQEGKKLKRGLEMAEGRSEGREMRKLNGKRPDGRKYNSSFNGK